MSAKPEYDVVVVGAGPTGVTLALCLAQSGLRTLVFDREADVYPLPRAAHIDHEIMRVFQNLGVGNEVAATCRSSASYDFVTKDGEILMQFDGLDDIGPGGWPIGNMIHQPSIERILRNAAVRSDMIDLHTGWNFVNFRDVGDGVEIDIERDGELVSVSSKYLVGADGARSPVREACGIELDDLQFDEPWLVVDALVHDYEKLPLVNLQVCDPVRPTTCVLMGSGRHRWEFMLIPGESPEEVLVEAKIEELLEPWNVKGAVEIERTAVYRFNAKIGRQWRKGRVFLAGDAVHLTPPFAGQGMCAGVRDAANLAWKLGARLNHGASDELLDTYEAERSPHARGFIELAIAMGRTVCTTDHDMAAARDQQMKEARAAGVTPAPPPALVLQAGCLADAPAAGHYFPQPSNDGKEERFDSVMGEGAWLISRTPIARCDVSSVICADLTAPEMAPFAEALSDWLDIYNAEAVLVRPDHYVFGAGDAAQLLQAWRNFLT